jgi:hypothetical protein
MLNWSGASKSNNYLWISLGFAFFDCIEVLDGFHLNGGASPGM